MQALAIVVWLIELDIFRRRRRSQVIDIDVLQAPQLGLNAAEHCVIRVARVASIVPETRDGFENVLPPDGSGHPREDSGRTVP